MSSLRTERLGHGVVDPKRRTVLNWLMGCSVAAFLVAAIYPIIRFLEPQGTGESGAAQRVLVGRVQELPEGAFRKFRFGRHPCIALNYQGGYYAYGATCTHLGCIVNWDADKGEIACPCHDGFFDPRTGKVLAGPPPSPLPKLRLAVEGGELYAVEWEDLAYVKGLSTQG